MKVDFYDPKQLDFSNSTLEMDTICAIKVCKNPPSRKYCKGCNTFVAIVPIVEKFLCLNRECIWEADGITKYSPSSTIMNLQKSNAFDPSRVPEPSVPTFWWSLMPRLVIKVLNPFGQKLQEKALVGDETTKVEQIPITWEGE